MLSSLFAFKSAAWVLPRALLLLLLVQGCATRNIADTDVEDTEFNRRVIVFCEQYRKAVERRNVAQLANMAAPSYFEDGGNVDPADDMDRNEFISSLKSMFASAKAIRYEIRYRRVGRGEKNEVLVDYTYSASYKLPTDTGDVWRRKVAENRLQLMEHGDSFLIVGGM